LAIQIKDTIVWRFEIDEIPDNVAHIGRRLAGNAIESHARSEYGK
jgi:hypothetical protein